MVKRKEKNKEKNKRETGEEIPRGLLHSSLWVGPAGLVIDDRAAPHVAALFVTVAIVACHPSSWHRVWPKAWSTPHLTSVVRSSDGTVPVRLALLRACAARQGYG
jgi:hypothetical protein